MTKKDYIAIAEIIAHIEAKEVRNHIANLFSDHFQRDNPRFDRGRFVAAVIIDARRVWG
jgi:hypothetical protein